mgnify:CR=1 FL=1
MIIAGPRKGLYEKTFEQRTEEVMGQALQGSARTKTLSRSMPLIF